MKALNLVPADVDIAFIAKRKLFFAFSAVMIMASVALTFTQGLNFGIDFKGGILIEVRTEGPADIGQMRDKLSTLGLGDISLQEFGEVTDVLIRIQRQPGGDEAQQHAVNAVKGALEENVQYRRTEFVGPQVSAELLEDGIMAVSLAILAILVYIWFRFEWQFGVGAVIALVHDVATTIGIFALMGFEFNLSTVAAVLTIAGYSINDTVVVYDRVREKLRKFKTMPLPELLNLAINKTLSRTIVTSLTTLLALLALFFLGGEVIRDFSFAMIWGVLIGTYSSICIAVPLLMYFGLDDKARGNLAGDDDEDAVAEPDAS
ncbi:MAG: protein translocase subunit SecF [Rhodospirillales bacterium]|nr:protein translocase subunit SecF [Rhodospirillales bacterium]MBO6786492.1 protein translocase subunit SecF [Rhodospirillales bacterium]